MKKQICCILTLSIMLSNVASAARSEQSAELNQLIESCKAEGYSVDYEKAAISVFEQFVSTEETDMANNGWTTQQKDYYQTGIERIYSETKENLEGYLNGTKKPKGSVSFADNGKREVFNNIFTDGDGKPLISIGFGHDNTVFTDSDFLKNAGSNNIQTEIGPTHNIAYHTNIPLWKALKNNNCDADVFGYSAALPQILNKTGVDKFVTSKISWSESNRMPYDSFMWEGIDGTQILRTS